MFVWFYSGTDDRFRFQNKAFARRFRPGPTCRTASSSCAAATTGPSGAATRLPPISRRVGARTCVEPSRYRSSCSSRRRRPAGCMSCAWACPGRESARRCRSTSCRGIRRRPSSPTCWSGLRPGFCSARCSLGPRRAAVCGAAARPCRRAVGLPHRRSLDRRRPADPGARRPRPRRPRARRLPRFGARRVGRRARHRAAKPGRPWKPRACVARRGGRGLNVLHAVLPGDDEGLLRSLTPDAVGPPARAAAVLAGIALLLAARGLARRRHRAWWSPFPSRRSRPRCTCCTA